MNAEDKACAVRHLRAVATHLVVIEAEFAALESAGFGGMVNTPGDVARARQDTMDSKRRILSVISDLER